MRGGSNKINIIGQKFGKLSVVGDGPKANHGGSRVFCDCDCGKIGILVDKNNLRRGITKHCGCSRKNIIHGHAKAKNKSKVYGVWATLLFRCGNPKNPVYKNVSVCERWHSFLNFLEDMGEPPFPRATLERINNSEGYHPNNVKWATYAEQSRNKKNNRFLTFQGKTQCVADWARELGIDRSSMIRRIQRWGIGSKTFLPPTYR